MKNIGLRSAYAEERMELVSGIPFAFEDWVFNECFQPVFVVQRTGGLLLEGRCSACGGEGMLYQKMGAPHRAGFECPFCGRRVLSIHGHRLTAPDVQRSKRVSFPERLDDAGTLFVWRYFFASERVDLESGLVSGEDLCEIGRDFISVDPDNKSALYERFELIGGEWKESPDNGTRIRWSPMQVLSGLERYAFGSFSWPEGVENALDCDLYRDFPLADLVSHVENRGDQEEMLEAFIRYPAAIAKLIRAGLYDVADRMYYGELAPLEEEINRGTSLPESMGLRNERDLTVLRELGGSREILALYSYCLKNGIMVGASDLQWLTAIYGAERWNLKDIISELDRLSEGLHGLLKYMRRELGLNRRVSGNRKKKVEACRMFLQRWKEERKADGKGLFPNGNNEETEAGKTRLSA